MIRTGVLVLGWGLLVTGVLASAALLVLRLVTELHTWHHSVIAANVHPAAVDPVLVGCVGLILVLRAWWRLLGQPSWSSR